MRSCHQKRDAPSDLRPEFDLLYTPYLGDRQVHASELTSPEAVADACAAEPGYLQRPQLEHDTQISGELRRFLEPRTDPGGPVLQVQRAVRLLNLRNARRREGSTTAFPPPVPPTSLPIRSTKLSWWARCPVQQRKILTFAPIWLKLKALVQRATATARGQPRCKRLTQGRTERKQEMNGG